MSLVERKNGYHGSHHLMMTSVAASLFLGVVGALSRVAVAEGQDWVCSDYIFFPYSDIDMVSHWSHLLNLWWMALLSRCRGNLMVAF